jgi:ligand-binding sensor domain-containing protein/signal transduction histidine kinase
MVKLRSAGVICAAFLALGAVSAKALDPNRALAQYGYQSWQTDSGLPQNTVHAIVQGRDGYLWIATEGGLVRFDGVEFRSYTRGNTAGLHSIRADSSAMGTPDLHSIRADSSAMGTPDLHPIRADSRAMGTPGLPSDLIDDLMVDRDGALWVSTSGGLARMRGGLLEDFGPAQGVPATQVWRTFQDARGEVWALTAAGLFRIDGDRATRIDLNAGLTENSRMAAGPDGALWLGTADGLMRAGADGAFHPVGVSGEVLALAVDGNGTAWAGARPGLEACSVARCRSLAMTGAVNALVSDAWGRMWVGTDAGLFSVEGDQVLAFPGKLERVEFLHRDREGMVWAGTTRGMVRVDPESGGSELLASGDVFLSAEEDREGDLWLGTESGGLAVLRDRKFSSLTAEDGLTDEYVLALAQAPNGHVAVGTKGGGLNVFRDGKFHSLTTAQGLLSNVVLTMAAAANGDVWVGTPDGLNLLHNGDVARAFTTGDGLADDFVRSLYMGRGGEVWIGTRRGLSRYENGRFTTWTAMDGLGSDLIGAMTEDRDGRLWIGTLGGLSRFHDGQIRNFTTQDGLSSNVVTALYEDSDDALWIGTNDGGLNRWRAGKIVRIASRQLPQRVIGILEDGNGFLWISSNAGIYRVSREALNRMAEGGADAEVMRFGVADGMRISECSSGGHPAEVRLKDGSLWFATLKGIARVDPEHMPVNRVAPQVAVERVSVDDAQQGSIADLTVAPGHSHYEFDYAGLSFVAPQKVEYRYQLEGFDRGWVDAGTRRAAYYTNLPHGRYTFRVIARNNDGVWSGTAATAELTIEPHVYQTVWFRLLVLLAIAGLGYAAWRRRLMRAEREFQAVLGERTRIAREIHDTLAQGFVAVSVHLELVAQLMRNSAEAAREQLARAQALVRSGLEDARTSIWELRSQGGEREDLAVRILKMAEETVSRAGSRARVQMQVTGTNRPLDEDVERELMRIAREAVTNAVRHGDAENIVLRLEFEGSMFGMEIRDDGRGFAGAPPDGSSGHFGLTGMRERAEAIGASLTVESSLGEGTTVRLALALVAQAGETETKT